MSAVSTLKLPPALGLVSSPSPGVGGIVAVCPSCKLEYDADDWDWAAMGPHGWEYPDGYWRVSSRSCSCGNEVRRVIGVSEFMKAQSLSIVATHARAAMRRVREDEAARNWVAAADGEDELEALVRELDSRVGDEMRERLLAMVEL